MVDSPSADNRLKKARTRLAYTGTDEKAEQLMLFLAGRKTNDWGPTGGWKEKL